MEAFKRVNPGIGECLGFTVSCVAEGEYLGDLLI
jgi:hypothetical protein